MINAIKFIPVVTIMNKLILGDIKCDIIRTYGGHVVFFQNEHNFFTEMQIAINRLCEFDISS